MAKPRKRDRTGIPVEQDSFLDIVANLVGILIILVVVIGSQIGTTLTAKESKSLSESKERLDSLNEEYHRISWETEKRHSDHENLGQTLDQQRALAQQLQTERDLMLRQILAIEQHLKNETGKLSENQKQALELKQKIADNDSMVHQLETEIQATQFVQVDQVDETKPEIIQHFPTPIAKTVFGEEVHFQLKDGLLVYAPLNELVQRLRATWETHAMDIPAGQSTIETIGPILDFRLQYELASQTKTIPTNAGVMQRTVVSLARFSLLPTRPGLGEKVESAVQTGSDFQSILSRFEPDRTTVSVWVYPESYSEFLDVRKILIAKGFRVAVWPLTNDQRISGSPEGLRSSAQ